MDDGDGVLGPITLSVPIVYYLRQETELYVSHNNIVGGRIC